MKRFVLIFALAFAPAAFADAGTPDAGTAPAVVLMPDGGLEEHTVALPTGAPTAPNFDNGLASYIEFFRACHQLVKEKDYGKLVFFIITFLVWVARIIAAKFKVKWLASGGAAIVMSFLWAGAAALATTWGAGDKLDMNDVLLALQYGFSAAGGWAIFSYLLDRAGKKWAWAAWLHDVIVGKTKPEEKPA